MTDNEIIKGLEICVSEDLECDECPYFCKGCNIESDALNLIKRQRAEFERLQADKDALIAGQETLQKYIEELNLMLVECYKTDEIAGYLKALQEQHKTAKTEAIKEFAERLKELSYLPNLSLTNMEVVDIATINNLVKEMTEGGAVR